MNSSELFLTPYRQARYALIHPHCIKTCGRASTSFASMISALPAIALAVSPPFAIAAAATIIGAGLYAIYSSFSSTNEKDDYNHLTELTNYYQSSMFIEEMTNKGFTASQVLLEQQKKPSQISDLTISRGDGYTKDDKKLLKELAYDSAGNKISISTEKSPSLAETYEITRDEQVPQQGLKLAH